MNRTAIYCGTRNLYHHMVTSAKSMLYHNGADTVWFLIEDDTFPEQLPSCVRTMNVSGQTYFPKDGPNYKSRWSYMILMRTVLTKLFPNLDKALIIDVDTIVCDDISDLWKLDLSRYYLAAVQETAVFTTTQRKQPYFNIGVSMFNLALLREEHLDDTAVQTLNSGWLYLPEQDALNSICYGHILALPEAYNSSAVTAPHDPSKPIRIKHFAARHPWDQTPEYLKYDRMTWDEVFEGKKVRE